MKCPFCVEEGSKSLVYGGMGTKTLMGGGGPFWDEEGTYHHHDPNTVTRSYHCTNGHRWYTKGKESCPNKDCDYGKAEHTITKVEPMPKPPTQTQTLTNKTISCPESP